MLVGVIGRGDLDCAHFVGVLYFESVAAHRPVVSADHMVLPIVVTGIAMIVVNSIALAFSLAGVVAAVRFRFSPQPAVRCHVYIRCDSHWSRFGIGALGVSAVISFTFVLATLVIWKLEYGKTLSGPFLTMLTRRDGGEDEY